MDSLTKNINNITNTQYNTLSVEELLTILGKIISNNPNTAEIRNANEILKQYGKNILSLEMYFNLIKTNENPKIRQLSALLITKRLEKHWSKLDEAMKDYVQKIILDIFIMEKNYLVLKSLADIIYRMIKLTFGNQENSQLLIDFIFRDPVTYKAEEINLFEVNLNIVSELIENNFIYVKNKINEIISIISNALKFGSSRMQENASKCLMSLLNGSKNAQKDNKNDIIEIFKELIPFFLHRIKNFREGTIKHIYENLCDLNSQSLKNIEPHFENLLTLTLELLTNETFSNDTKLIISEFLILISELNKEHFRKNENLYLRKCLEIGFKFAASPEDFENNDYPLYDIGERIIESLALLYPSKIIFPISVEISKFLLESNNENNIKAAIISLGLLAEGCSQMLKKNLDEIINLILKRFTLENSSLNTDNINNDGITLMQSKNTTIKSACIIAIDRFTEFCWPNILDYHDKIIPMLIYGLTPNEKLNHNFHNNINNQDDLINKSLICLKYFCKSEDLDIKHHINLLLPKLVILLNNKNITIQRNTLAALASILENARDLSSESLHHILEACKYIISTKISEDENDLRASALECVSHLAFSVKLLNFSESLRFFSEFAFECINSKTFEFQDAGFSFMGSLAQTIGIEFRNILDKIMPIIFLNLKDQSGAQSSLLNDEFAMDSDSENEIEDNGKIKNIKINEAFIDAKCSAILATTHISRACPKEFLKYLAEVLSCFDYIFNLFDENVNIEVILAYESLFITVDEAEKILKGEDANYLSMPLFQQELNCVNTKYICLTQKFWFSSILPRIEKIFEESDCKNEITNLLETIYGIVDHFGKDIFQSDDINNNSIERIIKIIKVLLQKKANCQLEEKKSEDSGDDIDHDQEILIKICDLIILLSEKLQNDFSEIFQNLFFENLKNYLSIKKPEEDRALVFGCIADVFCNSPSTIVILLNDLLILMNENIKKNIKKLKDEELFNNISYLIGIMFEHDPENLKNYLEVSLSNLENVFLNSENQAKDNVIAATARIAYSQKNLFSSLGNIFVDRIVETIILNIPLKSDPRQNLAVFGFLEFLLLNQNCILSINLDLSNYSRQIFEFYKYLLLNSFACGVDIEIIKKIKSILETMNNNIPFFKSAFDEFMVNGFINEQDKNKFISSLHTI